MTFQPFGDPFEIRSPFPPSDVKARIRSRKKSWFDPKNGARGWIIGPFLCLWFSALDRSGPMLIARISGDGRGTRVVGRAGSDLDGLLPLVFVPPVMAMLLTAAALDEGFLMKGLAVAGGLGLIVLLGLWLRHENRREAEPLVRFLRQVIAVRERSSPEASATGSDARVLALNVSGKIRQGQVTQALIEDALLEVGAGDFLVLSWAPQNYIQAAWRDGDFILERRDGDPLRHFRALRRDRAAHSTPDAFTSEEVLTAFLAYAADAPMPLTHEWEPLHLPRLARRVGP